MLEKGPKRATFVDQRSDGKNLTNHCFFVSLFLSLLLNTEECKFLCIRGSSDSENESFFFCLTWIFLSLCFLPFCVSKFEVLQHRKERNEEKKKEKRKTEVAFTNLRDNDMVTRQGFYSHIDYQNCPSSYFYFHKYPSEIIMNYLMSAFINNVLDDPTNQAIFKHMSRTNYSSRFNTLIILRLNSLCILCSRTY